MLTVAKFFVGVRVNFLAHFASKPHMFKCGALSLCLFCELFFPLQSPGSPRGGNPRKMGFSVIFPHFRGLENFVFFFPIFRGFSAPGASARGKTTRNACLKGYFGRVSRNNVAKQKKSLEFHYFRVHPSQPCESGSPAQNEDGPEAKNRQS